MTEPEQGPRPHWGFTRHGHPVHLRTIDHHPAGNAYQRFNKKVALLLTRSFGSMTAFWVCSFLCLLVLPSVLYAMGIHHIFGIPSFMLGFGFELLMTWFLSTFLELVLMPAIMVGQSLQTQAADARAAKQFEDLEAVKDWLDLRTQGGLTEVLESVHGLDSTVANLAQVVQQVMAARAEHDSAVSIDAKAARTAAESANVVMQVLAAAATGTTGPQPVLKDTASPAGGPGTSGAKGK